MPCFDRSVSNCLLWLVGSVAATSTAWAETDRLGRLPSKVGAAGFVLVVDMEMVGGNGYQPLYLNFSPLGNSFKRDHRLQVVIEPKRDAQTELDFSYRRSITLPEGSGPISIPVYVPHYYPWDTVGIRLIEDGRPIEKDDQWFHFGNLLRRRFAEQNVTVGIIAAADSTVQDAPWQRYPDVRTLVTILGDGPIPEDADVERLDHQDAIALASTVQPAWVQFRPIDQSKLQSHWLGYSQLDVIMVAAPLLERIEQQQPAEFKHLKDWLAVGGNLWIYAAANRPSDSFVEKLAMRPAEANRILAPEKVAQELNLNTENDTSELTYESWNGVQKESVQYSFRSNSTMSSRGDVYKKLQTKGHPFARTSPTAEIARDVQIGSFGLGVVVTIAAEDPFPGSFQFWKSIVDLHAEGQIPWTERMGIDVPRGNDNYWMWLIPSVGQPPVKSFVLLNTLFVILVGPVCYFFFRKRHRLYLLYVVAPCLALLVTTSLFAYALGSDGTKTKLRSRQLTWIDARGGYVVGQARQTYYAVLGSGGGIEFSSDAAVYPVRNTPAYNRYYRRHGRSTRRGEMTVNSQTQELSGNFFPPRSQVQYLMTRPEPAAETIEFVLGSQGGTVMSHLPYLLKHLVVRDAVGAHWQAFDVTAGTEAVLESCGASVLGDLLGSDVLPPLGSVPMLQGNRRLWGAPGTGIQVSSLENRLEQWSRRMPSKSFVAIAELMEDRLGIEDAVVLDSVHVVMGEIP